MSVAGIIDPSVGTIRPEFLPTDPTPHPYLENPFQSAVDGGNQTMTNVASLQIGASGAIPVGVSLNIAGGGNLLCSGKIGVSTAKYASDDGAGAYQITANAVGNKLTFQGPVGIGEVYDSVNNTPPVADTTVAQQITGTLPLISIPATGNANPAKTLATLTITGTPKNSFTVYLKLNTGTLTTPDGSPYVFQYFLSNTVDGNIDETKGCLVGYTPGISNTGSAFIPSTTLVYRPTTATNTIYLNIQSLQSTPHSGCQLANAIWTADVYASEI